MEARYLRAIGLVVAPVLAASMFTGCHGSDAERQADCKKLEQAQAGEQAAGVDNVDEYNGWVEKNNAILDKYPDENFEMWCFSH